MQHQDELIFQCSLQMFIYSYWKSPSNFKQTVPSFVHCTFTLRVFSAIYLSLSFIYLHSSLSLSLPLKTITSLTSSIFRWHSFQHGGCHLCEKWYSVQWHNIHTWSHSLHISHSLLKYKTKKKIRKGAI
jgi:hypothetical protein